MDSFIQDYIPLIVAEGAFGKNVNFVSFEMDKNLAGKDQFMSTVLFGTVTTSDGLVHSVLFKLKLQDSVKREKLKIDLQFHNEILMYEKIIPFLLACYGSAEGCTNGHLSLARYYYGRNKCGEYAEKDLIVLENVRPLGFRLSEEYLFLDYNHLLNAIQALAKFHALSYTAKYLDRVGFCKIIADVRDIQFEPDGEWIHGKNALLMFGTRGVIRLLERDGQRYRKNEHLRRFNELIADGCNSLRRALKPREPLSVLCHGDFNRNNVLFRYDAGGRPVDTLPFDLATPRYGSPALDLSFFLYMNTTQTMRESRYDDLLDAYCSTLSASVPAGCGAPDRAEVDAEMASSALFGFAHASFFLPFLMGLASGQDGDAVGCERGGETATEYVADMVQHFVDMGYTNV